MMKKRVMISLSKTFPKTHKRAGVKTFFQRSINNGLPKSAPYGRHMRKDLRMLLDCDAIYMLCGWERSKGATIEKAVAYSCGMEMIFEKKQ